MKDLEKILRFTQNDKKYMQDIQENKNQDVQSKTSADYNIRECPECGFTTIKGMPGGRDSSCENCGYKDPCCYDY